MKKYIVFLLAILYCPLSYAAVSQGYVPNVKSVSTVNGATVVTLQNGSIVDTGTPSASGNVGINSTNPGSTLDVNGSVRAGGFTLDGVTKTSWASTTGTWVGTSPGPIYYNTGNVGIGTSIPGALFAVGVGGGGSTTKNGWTLDVSGNATTIGGVASNFNAAGLNMQNQNGAISFGNYDTAGTNDITRIYNADATGTIQFAVGSTSVPDFTMTAAGNLGIGTTLPAYQIDQGSGTIRTGDTHFDSPTIGIVCQNGCFLDGNGGGPVLYAAQNRNIGIATSNPSQQLDVAGGTRTSSLTVSGGSPTSGYVLTATDTAGDASWQAAAGGLTTINNSLLTAYPNIVPPPYTCVTNYYVNPAVSGASDSYTTTQAESITTPWKTINGAIGNLQSASSTQAGVCLNVSPAAYNEDTKNGYTINGTINWTFTVSSANATAGETYTNNNITFTVASTIAGATTLTATTPSAFFPNTAGTLTHSSGGSGDGTITYSAATQGTINYFTVRSTVNRQAIITIPPADYFSFADCFKWENSNFVVMDGFVCNGTDSVAESNDTGVTNSGANSFDSHIQVLNGTWQHLGAAGIGVNHADYLTVAGNIVYHNADQNYQYNIQGSGISTYQPVASDGLTGAHNKIYDNLSYGNFIGTGQTSSHSDGNGIIIDDGNFDQSVCSAQPKLDITASGGYLVSAVVHSGNAGTSNCAVGQALIVNQSGAIGEFIVATISGGQVATVGNPITLVQGSGFTTASAVTTTSAYTQETDLWNNVTHDNGGSGIHVYDSQNTKGYNNTDWNEYTDPLLTGATERGGINCRNSTNCSFINNIAVTNPYLPGPGTNAINIGNTACEDSSTGGGDVWQNNDCYGGLSGNSYFFTVTGTATVTTNETYTNNGCTFTMTNAVTSAGFVQATGTCAPSSSGQLTRTSGGGTTPINFSAVSPLSMFVISGSSITFSNNVALDPGFLNPTVGNFRLGRNSPAVGIGINENLTIDADGKYIMPGGGYDLGAYQTNTISGSVALGQNLSANATTFTGNSSITGQLLQSGGNVGIGTVTPGTLLDVQGTARTLGVVITGTANGCGTFSGGVLSSTGSACGGSGSTPGGGQNAVQYNNSSTFTGAENVFSFNGTNVGIGTTNGLALFDVRGTTNIFSLNDSSFGNVGIGTSKANTLLQVGTGANGFQVNTAGNITAIGNSTSATLSSNTLSLTNSGAAISLNNGSSTSGSGTTIKGSQATNGFVSVQSTGGVGAGDFIKFIGGNNGGTEIGRMLGLGYVGIGTVAPGSALDVNGTLLNGLRFNGNVGIGTVTASTGGLQIGTDSAQVTIGTMLCVGTGNCVGQCTGTVVGDSCTTCTCLPK